MEPLELLASKVGTSDGQGRAREGEREGGFLFRSENLAEAFLTGARTEYH